MSEPNHLPGAFSRRRVLQVLGVLSLSALSAPFLPALAESADLSFTVLSAFLVNRQVSPILAQRYHQALNKHYPGFEQRQAALSRFIRARGFSNMDGFIAAVSPLDPFRQTATLIVKAWYTGVVGDDQNMELIAYADAMMYLPTRGILAIPTYGPGPDSWGSKPVDPATGAEP